MAERSMTRATPSLRLTASRPEIQSRAASLFFSASLLVVALQLVARHRLVRLLAVAVVRLVVEDEDVLHAHQVGHDALEHLAFGFQRVQLVAAALEQRAAALGELHALAELEGVVVGDDDLGAFEVVEHVAGHQFAAGVVAVRIVRLEDAQAVLDREARRDDQEAAGEVLAAGPAHGVDRLPGDEHRHDGRLAGAGGELQREAHQFGVGVVVGVGQVFEEALAGLATSARPRSARCRLDGFDLAEERADAAELVVAPVLEQARGLGRDLPVARVRPAAPLVHLDGAVR